MTGLTSRNTVEHMLEERELASIRNSAMGPRSSNSGPQAACEGGDGLDPVADGAVASR